MEDFNLALELDPHNSHIFYNRGNLFFMLNNFANAVNDYDQGELVQYLLVQFWCEWYKSVFPDHINFKIALNGAVEDGPLKLYSKLFWNFVPLTNYYVHSTSVALLWVLRIKTYDAILSSLHGVAAIVAGFERKLVEYKSL